MKYLRLPVFFLFLTLTAFCPRSALSAVDRDKEVREAVTTFVTTRTAGMGWDVHLRRISISDSLNLPDGKIDYEVVAPQKWEGWGRITITVLARQKERVLRNIPVRIDVEALVDTVVTVRQLEHGTTIEATDLALQKREITQNSHLGVRSIDEVAGKKTRTTLRANQPVRADQIERIPLIKSGQMVTIIAENSVFKISVTGKAHSSGAAGDIIRVKNMTSLKDIPAKVIDGSTVQVAF
ncbi:MAG: flagellar basal body P-ring formation chaperone FlgA [Desulfuromonadaceae bacterium]|nr:flagellar basal body P-ring formation chaperone FlgA [Desulfuromonadaceae bacterium]